MAANREASLLTATRQLSASHLATVLPRDAGRVLALLWKPCIVHYPCNDRSLSQHGGKHGIQRTVQQNFVIPRGIRHQMMQRLVHAANMIWIQTRCHRLAAYLESLAQAAGHSDRIAPFKAYCTGLLLPGERKSVEPMAAKLAPDNVRRMHQSLHHLVADLPGTMKRCWTGRWIQRCLLCCGRVL